MAEIEGFPQSDNQTPRQALQKSLTRGPKEVLIFGTDADGNLFMDGSEMPYEHAIGIMEQVLDHLLHSHCTGDNRE